MTNCPLRGRGQDHVTHFYIFWAQAIYLERMKLDISNLVCRLNVKSTAITHVNVLQYGGAFSITWPLKILGNVLISQKRYKINIQLQWSTNRKSHIEWHQYQWPWVTLNVTSCFQSFLTLIHQWVWHVLTTLCVYMNGEVSVVFNRNCFSKMKDYLRLRPPKGSHVGYKILQLNAFRSCHQHLQHDKNTDRCLLTLMQRSG